MTYTSSAYLSCLVFFYLVNLLSFSHGYFSIIAVLSVLSRDVFQSHNITSFVHSIFNIFLCFFVYIFSSFHFKYLFLHPDFIP